MGASRPGLRLGGFEERWSCDIGGGVHRVRRGRVAAVAPVGVLAVRRLAYGRRPRADGAGHGVCLLAQDRPALAAHAYAPRTLVNTYLADKRRKRVGEVLTGKLPERLAEPPSPEARVVVLGVVL